MVIEGAPGSADHGGNRELGKATPDGPTAPLGAGGHRCDPSASLVDPLGPGMHVSAFDASDAEIVTNPSGDAVLTLARQTGPDMVETSTELGRVYPAIAEVDGRRLLAYLKRRRIPGPLDPDGSRAEESQIRFRRELAVLDTSRQANPSGLSIIEEINEELAVRGSRSRVTTCAFDGPRSRWIGPETNGLGPELVLAVTRMAGIPLADWIANNIDRPLRDRLAVAVEAYKVIAAVHHLGYCFPDRSVYNLLVVDTDDGPIINLVDVEFADYLDPGDPAKREAWAPLVRDDLRYRLSGGRLGVVPPVYTHRDHSQHRRIDRNDLDTDLSDLAVVSWALTTGSTDTLEPADAASEPGPLRYLLERLLDTDQAAADRAAGRAPELFGGEAIAEIISAATLDEGEEIDHWAARTEPVWENVSPGLAAEACRFASGPDRPPAANARVARWWLRLADADDTVGMARAAVSLNFAATSARSDAEFAEAVIAAGFDAGANGDLASVGSHLVPLHHAPAIERLGRSFPAAAPSWSSAPPAPEGPVDYLTPEWQRNLVHRSSDVAARHWAGTRYGVRIEDLPEASFTFEIDGDGHLSSLTQGLSRRVHATATTDSALFADYVDGTVRFPTPAGRSSDWAPLAALMDTGPDPAAVRAFTTPESWPDRSVPPSAHEPFSDGWLDAAVAHARHLPSALPEGARVFTVDDDSTRSFVLVAGRDGRVSAWHRDLSCRASYRTSGRRDVLLERLWDPQDQASRGIADPSQYTAAEPPSHPFLSPRWAAEVSVAAAEPHPAGGRWNLVVDDRPFVVDAGGMPLVRPGRGPGAAYRTSAARLWDAMIEGYAWPEGPAPPPVATLLCSVPRQLLRRLSAPSADFAVPPGESERRRERVRRRTRKARRDHQLGPLRAFREVQSTIVADELAGLATEVDSARAGLAELLADPVADPR